MTPVRYEQEDVVKKADNSAIAPSSMAPKANDIAWGVTLLACWFWTFKQLSLAWCSYQNYNYGYIVPCIAVLLALRRIQSAPGCLDRVAATTPGKRFFSVASVVAAWGLFLFAELARQFDPHWRMVSWVMTGSVTLLTAIELWRRGGNRLLRLLAFPLGFIWTAVPWPTKIEETVMLSLRDFITKATVVVLNATGIKAGHHGNIIDLASGNVVVDSACSGISSFQVNIMASLFLGEFFRFGAAKRLFLVAVASLFAVTANLVRAIILVRLANDWGPNALLTYHDRLGYAETAGIFLALLFVAWLLSLKSAKQSIHPVETSASTDLPKVAAFGLQCMDRKGILAGKEGWAVLLAFASLPFITSAWFALSPGGPIRAQDEPLWLVKQNPVAIDWHSRPVSLSPIDIRTLDYTEGQTVCLDSPMAMSAVVCHFFWKTDASTGFGHTPDICMVAAGWKKEGDPVRITMRVNKAEFPCKLYRFKRNGEEEVVFQSVWYGGDPLMASNEFPWTKGGPRASRLAMLWKEPRRRGVESLSLYMPPFGDQESLTRAAEEFFAQVLVPNSNRGR